MPGGWRESRCDSVCLRSRHFVAWPRPRLRHNFPPYPGLAELPAGWTESRCDSVCLRSRHFAAWPRQGLTHDFPPGLERGHALDLRRKPAALRFAGGGSGRSATTAGHRISANASATATNSFRGPSPFNCTSKASNRRIKSSTSFRAYGPPAAAQKCVRHPNGRSA